MTSPDGQTSDHDAGAEGMDTTEGMDADDSADTTDDADAGGHDGATTQTTGTPMAVELASTAATRHSLGMLVAGPTVWFGHFMLVYLVAEAGCTGGGPGMAVFDPPVPAVTTLVATAVAAAACLWVAWWHHRRWRHGRRIGALDTPGGPPAGTDDDPDERPLSFVGLLLGLVSLVAVLFVGLPALWLTGC